MSNNRPSDSEYMAQALTLARRGQYSARPNPMVGCVIVAGDEVVGRGWHKQAGEAHAEINALAEAGSRAAGSTVYVTLEPCAHHGRTPPCSEALIAAGVARVVFAIGDPFAAVAGKGAAALQAAGIELRSGLLAEAARTLNAGYLSRVANGRPRVRLKIATSLDGATAMANGESQWITGPEARRDVQRLRARSGAVMTGVGTMLADDPALTVREPGLCVDQPMRVIADTHARTPVGANMFSLAGETRIYCALDHERRPENRDGVTWVTTASRDGRVNLAALLDDLGKCGINDLLVECGPTLAGALLAQGLVDELVIYQAPHIMGSNARPMFDTPSWQHMDDRQSLEITDVRRLGADTRLTARVCKSAAKRNN